MYLFESSATCCVQLLTEPGVEEELDEEWAGKLVFVDGMDDIVQKIELYRGDQTLREEKVAAATAHAKAHYAVELYLGDFLEHDVATQLGWSL